MEATFHWLTDRAGEPSLAEVRAFVAEVARDLDPDTRYLSELLAVLDASQDLTDYEQRLSDPGRVASFRHDGSRPSQGERGLSWVGDEIWEEMDVFERTLANLLTGETRMMWAGEGAREFARLAEACAGHQGELKILSIPCSTGKEVYSLAIASLEAGHEVRVVGADRQEAYVEHARSGQLIPHPRDWEYPRAGEFLERNAGGTRVREHVRERCRFVVGDVLTGSLPFGPFDLVSSRNLLGYFRGASLRSAWQHVTSRVRPAGLLLLDQFVTESDEMELARELLQERGFERLFGDASYFRAPG